MPEATHQKVSITVEGIMVLGFTTTNGVAKCTFGIPHTNNCHKYQIKYVTKEGVEVTKTINARSMISLVGPGASAGVKKVNGFNALAIDWNDDFFHDDDDDFRPNYKFEKCLEVNNGEFSVKTEVGAQFRTGGSTDYRYKPVAEEIEITITVGDHQRVIFVNDNEVIDLTDMEKIEITNICDEEIDSDDFQFYYDVFDVPEEKRLHATRVPLLERKYLKSINLPCWLVIYDDPPSTPYAP